MRKIVCLLLAAVSLAATVSSPGEIRDSLEGGNTVKAARLAEQALQSATGADAVELRYLLFKTYVMDLQPRRGKLFKQTVGRAPDGMVRYQERLDAMEADLQAAGEPLLPLFTTLLDSGDDLDRLLVLGLLEKMASANGWDVTPAVRASLAAADQCVKHEAAGEVGDPYFQSVYSLLSGLAFLSHADPAAAAGAAAVALECRGAAGWIVQDREQLERLGPDLAVPLRSALNDALRDEVKVDALLLLGRFGRCDDLDLIRDYQDESLGLVAVAADSARRRMQRRLGC